MLGLFFAALLVFGSILGDHTGEPIDEHDKINETRMANGASILVHEDVLIEASEARSEEMDEKNFLSHFDPDTGELLFTYWLNELGHEPEGGEIICRAREVENCYIGWLNSPPHRSILLQEGWTHYGLGYEFDEDTGLYYVTALFSTH